MPRLPRFDLIDVPQHIIQRGNNRQACFFEPDDYLYYLECLRNASADAGCDVHAYVLMTNHVHLLATPRRANAIPRMMQAIGRRYVQHVNKTHKRTGTLWEGRYRASLVEAERYLLTCYRYIELNPVRARDMADTPEDYPWSSVHANALGHSDACVTSHALYESLGQTPEKRQAAYRELLLDDMPADTFDEIRQSLNQGVVLGGDNFRAHIESTQGIRARPGRRGRPAKDVEPDSG